MRKKRKDQVVVKLKPKDRKRVAAMIQKGRESARVLRRALLLRLMDRGKTSPEAAEAVGMTAKTARNRAYEYNQGGLSAALYEKPRPGQKPRVTTKQKNQIIAMVCSSPPEGYARWSVILITEEAKRRKIVKTSRETVRLLLRKHGLKPWQKKNVVHRGTGSGIH